MIAGCGSPLVVNVKVLLRPITNAGGLVFVKAGVVPICSVKSVGRDDAPKLLVPMTKKVIGLGELAGGSVGACDEESRPPGDSVNQLGKLEPGASANVVVPASSPGAGTRSPRWAGTWPWST